MDKGYLHLEDGTIFEGTLIGAKKDVFGEVVFSTGMVGYTESLTDSSYRGQILVFTYPLIGNYGVPGFGSKRISESFESEKVQVRGLVVSKLAREYSHFSAKGSLDNYLKCEGITGIEGIDTRMLTVKIREKGVMLGHLGREKNIAHFEDPNAENLVSQASIARPEILGKGKKKILLLDCGVKNGILSSLLQRKATVIRVPWNFDPFNPPAGGFSGFSFDGVVVSNGPGDPKKVPETITIVRKIIAKRIPLLGICLGNQILALAAGGETYKLKYGHRSHNQPVRLAGTKKCFLTTQNHGFAVDCKKLPGGFEVWFENLNDGTNEGLRHKNLPFMSVQFHPEGRPGPTDTEWVFDEFIKSLKH